MSSFFLLDASGFVEVGGAGRPRAPRPRDAMPFGSLLTSKARTPSCRAADAHSSPAIQDRFFLCTHVMHRIVGPRNPNNELRFTRFVQLRTPGYVASSPRFRLRHHLPHRRKPRCWFGQRLRWPSACVSPRCRRPPPYLPRPCCSIYRCPS